MYHQNEMLLEVLKLKLLSNEINCHMYSLLYMNFMLTTKKKPVTNTQKIMRKEYKHSTKESHKITKGENKRRRNEQIRTTKMTRKQLTK